MFMNPASPEHRRMKISLGTDSTTKLESLGASHAFTQQLDVVFPSSNALETALVKLSTRYFKGKLGLRDLIDKAEAVMPSSLQTESPFTMLSVDGHEDDVWCVDPRGVLTISASKESYEKLGIVGKKLPFKQHSDQHVIRIPLQKNAETVGNRARRNDALASWDGRRDRDGAGPWTVVYRFKGDITDLPDEFASIQEQETRQVRCEVTRHTDVLVPRVSLAPRPHSGSNRDADAVEDWDSEMEALFEWVGMACLGSQRLQVNDRVDPYVCLYSAPQPSTRGGTTHLRWRGFLGPDFVQSVIDTALQSLDSVSPTNEDGDLLRPFVAITSHAISASPVSYIPPQSSSSSAKVVHTPVRVVRPDGEDVWCLVIASNPDIGAANGSRNATASNAAGVVHASTSDMSRSAVGSLQSQPSTWSWCLMESLGQWDTRWG